MWIWWKTPPVYLLHCLRPARQRMTEGKSVFCWHKYNVNLDVKPSLFVISVFSQVLFCWYSFVDNSHLDPCLSSFFSHHFLQFSTVLLVWVHVYVNDIKSSKNYVYCKPVCRKTHKYWFLCKHTLTEAAQSAGWVCFVLHFEAAFPLISSASKYPLHFLAVLNIVYCNAREPAKSTAARSSIFWLYLFVFGPKKEYLMNHLSRIYFDTRISHHNLIHLMEYNCFCTIYNPRASVCQSIDSIWNYQDSFAFQTSSNPKLIKDKIKCIDMKLA